MHPIELDKIPKYAYFILNCVKERRFTMLSLSIIRD